MLLSPPMPDQASHQDNPVRLFHSPHAVSSDVDAPITGPSSEPLRLLLVERDETMRAILSESLAADFQMETVQDGLEACQAARRQQPDLIIIDLYIPGTDSLTLIRAVRANPLFAQLPIIVLAASTHKELLLRCLSDGASNFLLKPFNTSELRMCIRVELKLRAVHAKP